MKERARSDQHKEPRNQHYLPQCYLRSFAASGKRKDQLLVADKQEKKTFLTLPRNVASERDFNKIDAVVGQPNELEFLLARFEKDLGKLLSSVNTNLLKEKESRSIILYFASLVYSRNPTMREITRDFFEQMTFTTLDLLLSSRERWEVAVSAACKEKNLDPNEFTSYDDAVKLFKPSLFRVQTKRYVHLDLELSSLSIVYKVMSRRSWILVEAENQSYGFITCDRPIVPSWNDAQLRASPYPPGLGSPSSIIIFPLTRKYALIGSFDDLPRYTTFDSEHVAGINGYMVIQANRQLYAPTEDCQFMLDGMSEPRRVGDILNM